MGNFPRARLCGGAGGVKRGFQHWLGWPTVRASLCRGNGYFRGRNPNCLWISSPVFSSVLSPGS